MTAHPRSRFSPKLVLVVLISLVLISSLTLRVTSAGLGRILDRQSLQLLESHMKMALYIVNQKGVTVSPDENLHLGHRIVGDNGLALSAVTQMVGGMAVVVSLLPHAAKQPRSDMLNPAEISLDFPAVRAAVIDRRVPFRGIISLNGASYFIAVNPINDRDGRSVGAVLIGMQRNDVVRQITVIFGTIVVISGSLLVLFGLAFIVFGTSLSRHVEEKESDLAKTNARLDMALENMANGLAVWDEHQKLTLSNGRLDALLGVSQGELAIGVSMFDMHLDAVRRGVFTGEVIDDLIAGWRQGIAQSPGQYLVDASDNRHILISFRPMTDGRLLGTYDDITDRKRAEVSLEYLAKHDILTGLANRLLFHERMETMLSGGEPLQVLYMDLDHFKDINDTLGHPIGDNLLREVADRLRTAVPPTALVARMGGDEFVVVNRPTATDARSDAVAGRIIETMATAFSIERHEVFITTSIGVAIAPEDGLDSHTLLRRADTALYAAKEQGRGVTRFYDENLGAITIARQTLQSELRHAFDKGELKLYYQPLVNVRSGAITGFEALMRWHHATKGFIPPDQFIPVAEECGLIHRLGDWALHRACEDAAAWPQPVSVAVNISGVQFRSGSLVQNVESALRKSGLNPHRLELEITETVLLKDMAAAAGELQGLNALGVRIAIDDFGTGYSSLTYLCSFPFDKIKIDRSFIAGMESRRDCAAVVQTVINLANSLGITSLAEGVETPKQLDDLRRQGCQEFQGFLFSKPIPNEEVMKRLSVGTLALTLSK